MKWELKRDLFALAMIVLLAVLGYFYYPLLPDSIPLHFNWEGKPDNFGSRTDFLYFSSGIMIGLYLLLTFIPLIDPFRKKFEDKYAIFLLFRDISVAFAFGLIILMGASAKNGKLETQLLSASIGLIFILLGNYLPKLPRNFFFGIRSPWTIASETVWVKTHRISGILFVAAGLLMIVLSLLHVGSQIIMPVILVPLVIFTAFIYPYTLFRKLQKEGKA